ncbi:MAG: ABC transporter permease [Clostridia bacterium]
MNKIERRQSSLYISFINALKNNLSILVAFIVLFVVSCIVSPKFFTVSNQLSVLRQIATNALCAFAMSFVILTGGIDLSVGSFMSLAGCMCTVMIAWGGIPAWLSFILALGIGLVYGAINGLIITKLKMPPFIVTLAALNILRGISYLITGGRPVIISNEVFQKIGGGFGGPIPLPVFYVAALFIVFWFILNRTKYGRRVYAVGGNLIAAKYSGINTDRVIILAYIFSGVMASFAGILLSSRLNSGQPTIGDGAELDAIAACVVGGISMTGGAGTLFGTLLGAFIIGIISNILNLLGINSFAQLVVKGLIILVAVYIDAIRSDKKR